MPGTGYASDDLRNAKSNHAGADLDLVKPCQKQLEAHGVKILTQTKVQEVKTDGDSLHVTIVDQTVSNQETFALVLQTVGRCSNADQMQCHNAGIQLDEHGFVKVNAQNLQTTNPRVRAIGDIIRGHMLAHKATTQGRVAAEMVAGEQVIFDAKVIPSVAYTEPEVAWVGLTETEAKQKKVIYAKGVFPWAANGQALCLGRDEGLTKIFTTLRPIVYWAALWAKMRRSDWRISIGHRNGL